MRGWLVAGCHNTQHYDTRHNDNHADFKQYNKKCDTQHFDTQQNNKKCNTGHNIVQSFAFKLSMQSVVILDVILLNVVAPVLVTFLFSDSVEAAKEEEDPKKESYRIMFLSFNAAGLDFANKTCLSVCENCLGPGRLLRTAP
jgi:hypothetical protein